MSREEKKKIKKRWKQHKRTEKILLDRFERGTLYGITVTEADLLEQKEQRAKPKQCPNCKEVLIQDFCDLCGWNVKAELIYKKEIEPRSRYIPERVRHEVWRRDMGRCVQCDTQEMLEFDHIIPFSKGGSNTARNLQLLCEKCNRRKYDKI